MTEIIPWVSLIISVILLVVGIVKVVPELRNSDAGAAKSYMEAAQAAASELRDSQKEAKLELAEWKQNVEEYKKINSELLDRVEGLETGKRHLEEELELVKRKVAALETDKAKLELEKVAQLQRIADLEVENLAQKVTIKKLTERVQKLEQILRDNKIPIPNGDTGPLEAKG